ncbi:tetratricopeptide repeat protein [Brevibacillus antibioticus]|uniref:Tetratricopeptide repeat protein n=1 Tax=Brevibacillus antibioticus TaxID=2570228 RepID=A0A4U2YF01_9BACL|nr:tetratricopeptide repeat protein [Brevibacillus antibioticus]TKI59094.1 tetratricopeptide repeat protein [Brevibacillus antibioticus]
MDLKVLEGSPHYQLGEHYYEMGRYEQAREQFKQVLAEDATHPRLLYMMAYCEYQLDNYEEAYELCTNAIKEGFVTEYVYNTLGLILKQQKKWYEAEEAMLYALSLNPLEPSNIATYAFLMYETGHLKRARLMLEEAKRLDPMDPTVLHYQFYMAMIDGKKKEKYEALAGYMQVAEDDLYKVIKIGEEAYFRDDFKTAKEALIHAFMLDPTNSRVKELLDGIEKETHFLFYPNRIVHKLGGPIGSWAASVGLILLAIYLYPPAFGGILLFLLIFNVYTWISGFVYKLFVK